MPRASRSNSAATLTKASDRKVVLERTFKGPRDPIFRAYTDPTLIPQWWGPKSLTTTVDKMEVEPGGAWRYLNRDKEGNEHAFRGVFRDIIPPDRLVYTFEYEKMPGHIVEDVVTFHEKGGKTKVTATSNFESMEDRDAMLDAGMEEGAKESMERLAELLLRMNSVTA